jgi:hypothetical protein
MTNSIRPVKRTTQLWDIGDTLGMLAFGEVWKFGKVEGFVETFGGPGYKLVTDDGHWFVGTDKGLYVQCSFDGGGDPANQCDAMVPATELYCPIHKETVGEMQQWSERIDALEQQELRPAADEDLHPKRLDPTMIDRVVQLTVRDHIDKDPSYLKVNVYTGTLTHYEQRDDTIVVWFKDRGTVVQAQHRGIIEYTVKVF